ncbi:fatty acid hydroxylase domain-containing protein 2-like [Malaya genurostris]|uniref:fatty acid hydroxylase domain-containing protein 2-like n=1 Tax=Malaya genurostris TaxID=325434 RepID=UPI0026F399F9|nr:fatty acid hydroxylase domain-containing protein 2-like [Malaya genurostris]
MSCEVCQKLWERFLDETGASCFVLWTFGTTLFSLLVVVVVAGLFMFMDVTNLPKSMRKYKIQPGTNEPLTSEQLRKVVKTAFINMVLVGIPTLACFHKFSSITGRLPDLRILPTFIEILYTIPAGLLGFEFFFYYSHRLFHSKYLYKSFHKKHHEWTSPVALAAVYSHPLEHVICSMIPLYLGVWLTKAHLISAWVWVAIALTGTLHDHSGYHLPFISSSEAHDFHHLKFNQFYGVLGFLDWLHGTDDLFRQSKSSKRHRNLLGTRSAREVFPDD